MWNSLVAGNLVLCWSLSSVCHCWFNEFVVYRLNTFDFLDGPKYFPMEKGDESCLIIAVDFLLINHPLHATAALGYPA